MPHSQSFKPDFKTNIAGGDNILDPKRFELHGISEFLKDSSEFSGRELGEIFRFCTGYYELSSGEDEGGGAGFADPHYYC